MAAACLISARKSVIAYRLQGSDPKLREKNLPLNLSFPRLVGFTFVKMNHTTMNVISGKDGASQMASTDHSSKTETVHLSKSAHDVVRGLYDGMNRHDLESVRELIAEKCIYEDLNFPNPMVGKEAVLEFLKKITDAVSTDMQFVIDGITDHHSSAVGVTWHIEWRGKPFPFSKGCSFYHCEVSSGKQQIIYGRYIVEPATKPGDVALAAMKALARLFERFPHLAGRF
eukprot:Gb_22703 [translate_table: standard]